MIGFDLNVEETAGLNRKAALCQIGVPFPKCVVTRSEQLCLRTYDTDATGSSDSDFSSIALEHCQVLARWPDGSIRQVVLYFHLSLLPGQTRTVRVSVVEQATAVEPVTETQKGDAANLGLCCSESATAVTVSGPRYAIEVPKTHYGLFDYVRIGPDRQVMGPCVFELLGDQGVEYVQNSQSVHVVTSTQHYVEIVCKGVFLLQPSTDTTNRAADFKPEPKNHHKPNIIELRSEMRYRFFAHQSSIHIDTSLHNPRAALHKDGLWDLGDPQSVTFKSFTLVAKKPDKADVHLQHSIHDINRKTAAGSAGSVLQASSGGDYWQSTVHCDKDLKVTLPFKGWQQMEGAEVKAQGLRTDALVGVQSKAGACGFAIRQFWQNFPKGVAWDDAFIQIGLFPSHNALAYELQPGEKKTHTLFVSVDPEDAHTCLAESLTPVAITIEPAWVAKSETVPYFADAPVEEKIQTLIGAALSGEGSIEAKRNIIDEYGWRHFGDVYADHETLNYQGEVPLVSHYNNQYDILDGFVNQYLQHANPKWLTLAEDLAKHVCDIDLYHTQEDRVEYNGGLFWHTDHYADAATATHRTYSKYQTAVCGAAPGGGPGGEHCYSRGLLSMYWLTGDPRYKQAVKSLHQWITGFYEGDGTLLDALIRAKSVYWPALKSAAHQNLPAMYLYPLNRGVGNYIRTCLDMYELEGDAGYLAQAEYIIRHTVHPKEDILARHLYDIENTWFYTIFLQSVAQYLWLKERVNQLDEAYHYARQSFMHYAEWMCRHERFYLDKAEELDYPNHAWVAQEIRKANILYLAAHYDETQREVFKAKADVFYEYCVRELSLTKTRTYARMYAVLMQNQLVRPYVLYQEHLDEKELPSARSDDFEFSDERLGVTSVLISMCKDMLNRLRQFSLKKEKHWIAVRIPRFRSWAIRDSYEG